MRGDDRARDDDRAGGRRLSRGTMTEQGADDGAEDDDRVGGEGGRDDNRSEYYS